MCVCLYVCGCVCVSMCVCMSVCVSHVHVFCSYFCRRKSSIHRNRSFASWSSVRRLSRHCGTMRKNFSKIVSSVLSQGISHSLSLKAPFCNLLPWQNWLRVCCTFHSCKAKAMQLLSGMSCFSTVHTVHTHVLLSSFMSTHPHTHITEQEPKLQFPDISRVGSSMALWSRKVCLSWHHSSSKLKAACCPWRSTQMWIPTSSVCSRSTNKMWRSRGQRVSLNSVVLSQKHLFHHEMNNYSFVLCLMWIYCISSSTASIPMSHCFWEEGQQHLCAQVPQRPCWNKVSTINICLSSPWQMWRWWPVRFQVSKCFWSPIQFLFPISFPVWENNSWILPSTASCLYHWTWSLHKKPLREKCHHSSCWECHPCRTNNFLSRWLFSTLC